MMNVKYIKKTGSVRKLKLLFGNENIEIVFSQIELWLNAILEFARPKIILFSIIDITYGKW